MKCWSLLYALLFFSTTIYSSPLLVVVLMVKNESSVMRATLSPLVDAGIDAYLIYDTGSTDDTIQITQQFFAECGIKNVIIVQEPWVDFATSRNRALDLAEQHFSDAEFMLMPDAEWHLHNGAGLLQFCEQHKNSAQTLYLVRALCPYNDFGVARLIRCRSNARFVGEIHEVPNRVTYDKLPDDVYFELCTTAYGQEKSRCRWKRDLEILLLKIAKNPHDPRTAFYLGQTYACLGDWKNAVKWYEYRAAIHGWDEENFMAYFRLAQSYEALGDGEKAVCAYHKAFSIRPTRGEPLIKLAEYYWNAGEYALCFAYAKRAVELPYPASDILFVEKWLYDFVRYDLLGRSAWYVGEYAVGEKAVRQALAVCPEKGYLHGNLVCYLQHRPA